MDDSSNDIPVQVEKRDIFQEPEWDKLSLSVNLVLFKKFAGRPISFHCKIDNLTFKRKYEDLIVSHGGRKVEDYIDMDNSTALMVEDSSTALVFERPSFKVSYIIDCVRNNALLDIGDYLHNQYSFKGGNYMNVIFWENETFLNKTLEPYRDSSESADEEKITRRKHTRELYSRQEKEAILKFLLARKQLFGIRGDVVWRKMERRGVCPKRTYQSMKNHFLKTLLFELDKFEFLSGLDKKMLKKL